MHAAFVTAGVLAIAAAAELILAIPHVFWPTASIAAIALLPEANLFSFPMTESVTFSPQILEISHKKIRKKICRAKIVRPSKTLCIDLVRASNVTGDTTTIFPSSAG